MRLELLYNPRLLCERLGVESRRRRRLASLRGTVASSLEMGEIDSLELLELVTPRPAVVYDVGANVGAWTLLAKARYPDAAVHAFEPLAEHCEKFALATAAVPGVTLHSLALGRERATLPMRVTDFSDASSMLQVGRAATDHYGISLEREEPVPVAPLDAYVTEAGVPLPDLIKLDVQGYELAVLEGGERCLAHATHVLTEVSFVELYDGQALFHDVVAFLHARGLHLRALGEGTPLGAPLTQADALFVRGG